MIWVLEGITRVRTNLVYTISRAELKELSLEVPADYKVVNVFDPNVRQWSVAAGTTAGGAQKVPVQKMPVQKITAQLFEPAKAAQALVVELEKIAGEKRQETLDAPVVKALNVGRQQGFVVAQVSTGLRAEAAKTSGLLQIDAGELPPDLRRTTWTFAYRYASVPFDLQLALEEVQPRVTVDSLVVACLQPEKLSIDLTAYYNIERAGVFKLDLDVPEGFEVRNVAGAGGVAASPGMPPANYSPVEVESHHVEGEKKNHLVVNLSHKALGRAGLRVQLQRDLHDANLRRAYRQGKRYRPSVAAAEQGYGGVFGGAADCHRAESLRVNPAKAVGLRPVSFEEAQQGIAMPPRRPRGRAAPGARLHVYAGADRPKTLRRAQKAAGQYPPVARGADRRRRGEVPGDVQLQRAV